MARLGHWLRRNTTAGSRRNIAAHYDLGNEFFALFLDETMAYSCAVFPHRESTLHEASSAKFDRICQKLALDAGDHLLEIGTGWGGFAVHAARNYGCRVTTTTISQKQYDYTRRLVAETGLAERVTVLREDYRNLVGTYDKLVSIEMIEAVGEDNWPSYFQTVHDRLKPGGTAAIQAITINEADFEGYKSGPDFIQRYIFPGGMLLTKTVMQEFGDKYNLVLENVETFRLSYARTLKLWRERFLERWPMIAPLGYDEEFRRKWVYYLSYCEAGFTEGSIDVGIYQYRKPA